MSTPGGPVDRVAARRRLVEEGTVLEQLRRRVDEQRDAERLWEQRAELARARGRADLAEQALSRAAEHRERAGFLEAELIDQQAIVEEARSAAEQPTRFGPDPAALLAAMDVDPAEAQLGALEREAQLDQDLSELKATMGMGWAKRPPGRSRGPARPSQVEHPPGWGICPGAPERSPGRSGRDIHEESTVGLLDRVGTLVRANLNDLLDRAEDPEKVIVQIIRDMEGQLQQVKTQVAAAIADEKRLEARYQENQQKSDEWQRKAELAVDRANDELAKEALSRRNSFKQSADGFRTQFEEQRSQVQQLKEALRQLERKIEEARAKKDLLIARHRRAKAETSIRETMAGIGKSSAAADFDRMEERVAMQEARAKAAAELEGDSLDAQFAALEHDSGLDDELAALKSRRSGGALPSGSSSESRALEGPRQP